MDLPDNRGDHSRGFYPNFKLNSKSTSIIFAVAWLVSFASNAGAEITPRLEAALYYNDNATLAPSGEEQTAYITELKPGILLVRDGRRFDGRLDYTLQALNFSGDVNSTNTNHQLLASSTTTLVSQFLFVDAGASYSQQFITPDGAIDFDNLSDTENRTDILTYSLSPYIRQQYGSTANAEYRIGAQRVEYKQTTSIEQLDSTNNSASINFQSGPRFNELRWVLTYSYNQINYDEQGIDTTLQNTLLALRYVITPKFQVLANIGYEDNEYEQVSGEDPPSGSIWSAGFAWTPSRRTSLEVTAGERFFGSTASFNFSHRTRRTTWSITYSEDVTTGPQLQSEYATGGDPDAPPPLEPIYRQTTSVILLERLSFSVALETGKTTIRTELFNDKRDYQDTGERDDVLGVNLSWNWRFMPRTTAILSSTWYETTPTTTNRTDTLINNRLSVERRIRRTVTGIVSYGNLTKDSDDVSAEYQRNLVSLALRAEF